MNKEMAPIFQTKSKEFSRGSSGGPAQSRIPPEAERKRLKTACAQALSPGSGGGAHWLVRRGGGERRRSNVEITPPLK